MEFEVESPSGLKVTLDAYAEPGEVRKGPTPLEMFAASLGACSAMDVIAILTKKRQKVTGYRIEIDGDRNHPDGVYPRPYTKMVVRHILIGENLDPAAVQRAVELSDEKYCSVAATIRESPPLVAEWVIEEASS